MNEVRCTCGTLLPVEFVLQLAVRPWFPMACPNLGCHMQHRFIPPNTVRTDGMSNGTGPSAQPQHPLTLRRRRARPASIRLQRHFSALRHGDHLCAFTGSTLDTAGVLAAWVREARKRGETCIYVNDERTLGEVSSTLVEEGIVFSQGAGKDLALLNKGGWRHPGEFDAGHMATHVRGLVDEFHPSAERGLWVAVEMTWVKDPDVDAAGVAAWEHRWNRLIRDMPIVLLCVYSRERFSPEYLRPQLHTHPMIVDNERVYSSCYYQEAAKGGPAPSKDGDFEEMLDDVKRSGRRRG